MNPQPKPYVLSLPHFLTNSAGIFGLFLLNDHINQAGFQSRVLVDGDMRNPPTDTDIVLIADCFAGNHYKAKNVVRLLMMTAGYFGPHTDSDFPESEYMYYYVPDFILNGRNPDNILTIPMLREERFPYRPPEERIGSACLNIKYNLFYPDAKYDDLPSDCVFINKQLDLAELFSSIKTLYTYDNSAMNIEAGLCGIEVEYRFNPKFERRCNYGDFFDYNDIPGSYKKMKEIYFAKHLPDFLARTQERFKE